MTAKTGSDEASAAAKRGIYVESSALVKVYLAERESDDLDDFLKGRRDLIISELCITEVISGVARRRREDRLDVRQTRRISEGLEKDAASGFFRLADLIPAVHRDAERVLLSSESIPLRTPRSPRLRVKRFGVESRDLTRSRGGRGEGMHDSSV